MALKELKIHNEESTDLLLKNGAKQENVCKDQQRLECGNIGNKKCLPAEYLQPGRGSQGGMSQSIWSQHKHKFQEGEKDGLER